MIIIYIHTYILQEIVMNVYILTDSNCCEWMQPTYSNYYKWVYPNGQQLLWANITNPTATAVNGYNLPHTNCCK
jgi:hypothetical protein